MRLDPKRQTVKDQLFVVCESPLPCSPVGNSLWEIAGFGQSRYCRALESFGCRNL